MNTLKNYFPLKTMARMALFATILLGMTGCLESTLKVVVHPDRSAAVEIQALQSQNESLAGRLLMTALDATALSISDEHVWQDLAASMGKGVSMESLDIQSLGEGRTRVAARYRVKDIRTLKIGLCQAAPALQSLNMGPAAWSYRFTWKEQAAPLLTIIPPRPRPQPGVISPREALDQVGGAALGERSLPPLLSGTHIKVMVEAAQGLQQSSALHHPRYPDHQVLLLDIDFNRLVDNGALPTLLDIKDYQGLKEIYRYHPKGLFMQDPEENLRLELRR